MTARRVASLLASLLLVVAACGTADDAGDAGDTGDDGPAEPTPAPTVDSAALGGTWILVHADIDGAEPAWAADRSVNLTIGDGKFGGGAPCNDYGANVTIGPDGSVELGPIEMTAMSCGDDLDTAEQAYLAALSAVTSISVEGDGDAFTLDGPRVTLHFMRDADRDGDPEGITSIDGDWVVDELRLDGDLVVLDPAHPITVTIDGDEIRGTAACNQFGGRLDLAADAGHGTLAVVDVFVTEMACEPVAMQLEQAFLAALRVVDSYEAADGVYVAQAGQPTNFHLRAVEPTEPTPLTGTTWVLDTYIEGDAASSWPGMELVHITFAEEGSLDGATACVGFDGGYSLSGDRLSFERLDRLEIADLSKCDDGDAELSAHVFDVLEGSGIRATIDGDRLTIESDTSGGYRAGLSFRPTTRSTASDGDAGAATHELDPTGGVDGPVMYAERIEPGGDQMAAEIVGTLELDGECLHATSGGVRYPVLWPFGTTWDAETEAVVLPDGVRFAVGDEVHGGGGYLHRGLAAAPAVTDRIETCAEEPYFEVAVLQSW